MTGPRSSAPSRARTAVKRRVFKKLTWRRRQQIINARLAVREVLDPRRPLPDALIIGAQRSGTSSLYKWLEAHPDVGASLRKETEYLTNRFGLGLGWYRGHFPSRLRHRTAALRGHRLLTFEATPGYLSHPLAAERAAALLPRAKLIVLLRDPAERAISQYVHERRRNHESLELEEALAAEPERLAQDLAKLQADPLHPATEWERHSYLARGRYAEQLERWLGSFDRSQLLIVRSEDLYEDSANVYRTVLSFLQLREWAPPRFDNFSYVLRPQARRAVPVSDEARAWLRDYFRPHNDRLREMLGRDFEWS